MFGYHEPDKRAGWEADTPSGDTFVRDYVVATADWLEDLAGRCDQRFTRDGELALHDPESPEPLVNQALVLDPALAADAAALAARLQEWYDAGSSPGFALFSPWPTADLRPHGFELGGHPPLMLRPAGGVARPAPAVLEVTEVHDAAGLDDFSRVATLGFPIPSLDGRQIWPEGALDVPGFHLFVGYAEGEPVCCAGAHIDDRLQHVELVATRPEWRGRGFGEAITWPATLIDATKPAGLLASDDGRPVYERMGYVAVSRFTNWVKRAA